MKDRYKEDRTVEKAVDLCFDIAKRQANPYTYLYHNPNSIQTMQHFAHWTQRYLQHKVFAAIFRASQVTGYEAVPYALLYQNAKRDGWAERKIRCGALTFYLIKLEEMPPGLKRRYLKFQEILTRELSKLRDQEEMVTT